jgi:DNA-binding winged helix-turn-helix (wHTH) protein/tetratricopeptide (TPR) repeat protein
LAIHLSERMRFGEFELNLQTGELVANELGVDGPPPQKVLLREQPFRILRILIERGGGIVTRDEIKKVLWPNDTIVDFDRSINVAMAILRKAVGDTAENPKYIETLPRRGYRLIVPVQRESTTEPPKAEDRHTSAAELRKDLLPVQKELRPGIHLARSWLATAAAVLVLFTAAAALYWGFQSRITLSSSDTLVLADVSNQSADAVLDDGMNIALQVALQQTPYLNLLGSDKVHETLRLLRRSEDTRITSDVALEICRKTNSRAVISAFIRDAGNRFRVGLSAIDCQSGKTLEQVVHEAETREDIVRIFGLAASQLRLKLGESSRLTVPSRFQVETVYYGDRQEWDKECSVAQQWVQAFPRDVIARTNLANGLEYLGRHDEELGQAREAARLLPSAPTLIDLLAAAIYAQRIDEARQTYDEAVLRGVDSPRLHLYHALLAFLQNDTSGMQKEWAWAAQDPVRGRFVLYRESRAEGFYGRSRNAHSLGQRDVESSMKAGFVSDAAGFESLEALTHAEIGSPRQSQALVKDALRKSQDRNVLMLAAFTFARAGNTKQSQELMEKLNQLFSNDFTVQAFSLPATRAAIKLEENDPAAAIDILRPVTPYDLALSDGFYYVYPAYLRGLAYLQLNQGDLAAAEFRKVLDHSAVGAGFVTGALSVLQLGRAQVLMHDEKAARKSYEDFLALWKNADSDLPIYEEAKAEYAVLRKTIGI